VAKRTRGSRRDRRRGGRPTTVAPAARAYQAPAPLDRAADAADASTTDASLPARLPSGSPSSAAAFQRSGRLSAVAGEYRYVTLDLRRIAAVIGTLLAAMLALWVAADVVRVISL
jgi:hypothetical protein